MMHKLSRNISQHKVQDEHLWKDEERKARNTEEHRESREQNSLKEEEYVRKRKIWKDYFIEKGKEINRKGGK